ncbi:hypothetical protein M408DRAFT_327494 [Serendipita vermifera MAFF 305830]|uniref:Carbohydrate-binding module family 19 domain-containing protein n=1 Tax=Serendipita vermifera MAFF 305830 TaxID=933852 RepID=A0A0C2WYS8_SERVB|nr:hypothetical protein M408DRAFT_327494 [Serendipita vermifera MAFF 305830]
MLALYTTIALAAVSSVSGAPLMKRIAQNIPESTAQWEQACLAAGGGQQCNPLSVAAFSTLLAAPGPCAQQDAADNMIDLALTLQNNAEMIRLTQIFRQQPRNAPDSLSVLYCQQAPRNSQLDGLFQCQFQGVNDNVFTGQVALGAPGTIPFGKNSALSPPGSCPANPGGKIADGTQLVAIAGVSPGVGNNGNNNNNNGNNGNNGNNNNNTPPVAAAPAPAASSPATNPAPTAPAANQGNGGFQLQNALDAQALNAGFDSLAEGSPCTVGQNACINGNFAQCPFGSFVTTGCSGGTVCFALPLVNKAGTSITCTTNDDANRRFEAAGASGGPKGNGSGNNNGNNNNAAAAAPAQAPAPAPAPAPVAAAPAPAANQGNGGFQLQNALDAQALNVRFESLAVGSPCTVGENACIDGNFAQCPNGVFVTTGCAGGTTCLALPLVNKAGTSITCTTNDDAARRFEAAGASGGPTGRK